MSPSEPSPGGVAAALARAARAQPEAPCLFYRDARGQFRWWSFATAAGFLEVGGLPPERLSVKGVVVEREAMELLGGFLRVAAADGDESAVAATIPDSEQEGGRDVWISWRTLSDPQELSLSRWALLSGAAIVVEPGPALHAELFAWARPTVVSGSVEELGALADQVEALAPRFLRRRWLRQRGERLRVLAVSGRAGAEDLTRLAVRWHRLSPTFAPRVIPIALGTLV